MWIVMCKVSGGISGTRIAPLKANGVMRTFATQAEAQAEAARLIRQMNHAYSVADFHYWAVEEGGSDARVLKC